MPTKQTSKHQHTLSGQSSVTKQKKLQKMVSVTHLGTSYDFNKLKKTLDCVQTRNQQNPAIDPDSPAKLEPSNDLNSS